MAIQLNHTIVHSRDKRASAEFLGHILGLKVGPPYGPFLPVETANGVTLDYMSTTEENIPPQHYAFLVSESEFDEIFGRLKDAGITYYSDPVLSHPHEINRNDGGRGVYFLAPDGHVMEAITVPYGGWK
jgi:catechol 2,3-dioxygenase-like lactoylglutathione lyase family enzyme